MLSYCCQKIKSSFYIVFCFKSHNVSDQVNFFSVLLKGFWPEGKAVGMAALTTWPISHPEESLRSPSHILVERKGNLSVDEWVVVKARLLHFYKTWSCPHIWEELFSKLLPSVVRALAGREHCEWAIPPSPPNSSAPDVSVKHWSSQDPLACN